MKLLIAEDDRRQLELIRTFAESWGYQVESARDGLGAWEILQSKDAPKLVLLDWMMTGMDGVEIVRRVRETGHLSPYVILLSARDSPEEVALGLRAGADDYIKKPIHYLELQARLEVGRRFLQMKHTVAQRVAELKAEIGERQRAEAQTARLLAAIEQASEGVVITDTAGKIEYVNDAFTRITGYSRETVLGGNPRILKSREHNTEFYENLWATISAGHVWRGELVNRRADGTFYMEEMSITPARDSSGSITSFIAIKKDISARNSVEAELARERHFMKTLMDSVPDMIYFKDESSRFIRVNQAMAGRLGISEPKEAIGKTDHDFFSEEHASEAYADERQIVATGRALVSKEERETWPDGRVTWVTSTKMALYGEGGKVVGTFGISRDITQRKHEEEVAAEQARQTLLRAEVGAALTGRCSLHAGLQECAEGLIRWTGASLARIWTLDPGGSLLVLEASAGICGQMDGDHAVVPMGHLGVGRIAQDRVSYISNDLQNDPEIAGHECVKSEGLVSFVGHPLIARDELVGVVAVFSRSPIAEAILASLTSVADRIARFVEGKHAEEALRRSEALARLLFRAIPHPAYVFDLDTFEFLEINERALEHYGYTRDEFLTMKATAIQAGDGAERLGKYRDSVAKQAHHCTKDGRVIEVEITSHVIDYGGRSAALTIVQDVTERKKMEVDLRHAQKLESVGRLASGIAHEINTPIQFVGDNLHFLQDAFGDLLGLLQKHQELTDSAAAGDIRPGLLENIQQAVAAADLEYLTSEVPQALCQSLEGVSRVATIVKAMKDFAHPQQNQKMPANLNEALASTLVVARNEFKYVADVETDFGDLPLVECHISDLNQVFLNLLINAVHAIADVVHGTQQKGKIRLETRQDGDYVRVAISDTGSGIPEQIRSNIFDPFFTTKEVGRGTGQGLAISRSIVVDKHGGTLTFDTELGRGTTFFIGLPIAGRPEQCVV
jgi:PAS domain S-box-containing protein